MIGGNTKDLGNIDGINQWNIISKNEKTKKEEILLNIDEVEETSGIIGFKGKYKLLNGNVKTLHTNWKPNKKFAL